MTKLWRVNLWPGGWSARSTSFAECIDKDWIGIGGGIKPDREYSWPEYKRAASKYLKPLLTESNYRQWTRSTDSLEQMKPGDLAWTSNRSGKYYLGRIIHAKGHDDQPRYLPGRLGNHDVTIVRDCKWEPVGTEEAVPAIVMRMIRQTIQEIKRERHPEAFEFSKIIANEKFGTDYPVKMSTRPRLLNWLSPYDLEDVVGLYLQDLGYDIIPSTCRSSTPKYEFLMVDPKTGGIAGVQVKSNDEVPSVDEYKDLKFKMFFFLRSDRDLKGQRDETRERIPSRSLEQFVSQNMTRMPERIRVVHDYLLRIQRDSTKSNR